MNKTGRHPITSVPGALVLAAWSVYVLLAAFFYLPDIPPSVLTIGLCGLLAGLAVALNFAHWHLVAILASCVYLVFYAVRVARMVAMTTGLEVSSLVSALSMYYSSSWLVTIGMIQEKGVASSLTHGYLEYAMPVLSLALIVLAWMSRRRRY